MIEQDIARVRGDMNLRAAYIGTYPPPNEQNAHDQKLFARGVAAIDAMRERERKLREVLSDLCDWAEEAYANSPKFTTYAPIGKARTALKETAT